MGEFDQRVDLPALDFQKLNIGPYSNNVYVLTCKATKECVIIDTSHSAEPILAACEGATPQYILQTHCHGDHIDALDEVRSRTGAPLGQHAEDAKEFGISPDFTIADGEDIKFGEITLRAIHTPGHCKGMLMFLYPGHCVCGDTIFPGGPGKTWNHGQLADADRFHPDESFRPARRYRSLPRPRGEQHRRAEQRGGRTLPGRRQAGTR